MPTTTPPRLIDIVSRLRIAHHIPGRIRLALNAAASAGAVKSVAEAQGLMNAFATRPGIRRVNLNVMARSCTVEYDATRIPPAAWEHVIAGVDSPEAGALVAILNGGGASLTPLFS